MATTIEAPQQECSAAVAYVQEVTEKLMTLKLSQLKKRAKKNGISDEAIETAAAGADTEDDTNYVLIRLITQAAFVKATPSPTRARASSKMMFSSQTCAICPGCVRPPNHEGACMDGQCNEIFPEPPQKESSIDVGAEVARHKALQEKITVKLEEKAAAEEETRRKAEEEKARRKAVEEARRKEAAEKIAREKEEARRKAEEEKAAQQKAAEEEAARQRAAEEQAARQRAAEEEAAKQRAVEQEAEKRRAEEEAARQQAAEEAAWQKMVEEEQARQKEAERAAQEEEQAQKDAEQAARDKEMEEARARRQAFEDAAMAEMDAMCVNTFLDCVCGWRDRIRTPIKGTMLYTKHIRPARPAGTSVDVKDSSFQFLGKFLEFLQEEGLLRLKPGLTDPVVTDICVNACRDYKYVPRAPSCPSGSPTKGAREDSSPGSLTSSIGTQSLSPMSKILGCPCARRFQ